MAERASHLSGPGRRLLRPALPKISVGILLLAVALLTVLPLLRLLALAFVPGTGGAFAGLIVEEWSSPAVHRALANTVTASLGATALSVAIGAAIAFLVSLTNIRARPAIVFCLFIPLLVPSQVTALAWIELLGPQGPLLAALGLSGAFGSTHPLYSGPGIMLVMGVEHACLGFLSVRAALQALPGDLVEAARLAGARPGLVVRAVILPLALPALLAGAALAFVASIGNFGVPALLGIPGRYPMLTTLIFQRLQGFGLRALGEVAAISLLLALLAAAVLLLRGWTVRTFSATAARSAPATPFDLGRARPAVEAALWFLLVVIAVLPLLALLAASVTPALGAALDFGSATLRHYRLVLLEYPSTRRAFANSFLLAAGAALICCLLVLPLAYAAVFQRVRAARALNVLADLPYAVPGTVLAIAIVLTYLPPLPLLGVSLYNTGWIILVAYVARFLALAQRPMVAALEALDPALDEAARSSGARLLPRLRLIIAPLASPAALAAGLLIFMQAYNELTVSALLWSTGWETVGVAIFSMQREGNSLAASAMAVLSVAATFLAVGLAALLGRRASFGFLPWRI